jgi:isopenicillin N synthase-like dioxygenase
VNIGQAFEVVSPGVCKATAHRILSGSLERYSEPFFQRVRGNLSRNAQVSFCWSGDVVKRHLRALVLILLF